MSLRTFVKRNWLMIVSIVSAIIITWFTASYHYKKTMAPAEPVFLLDPARTIIVDSKRFLETPLRVIRPNGDEIKGDVTSIRFYFWNNSWKSIEPSNILEPLVITLDDLKGEILDYRILKYSREVVKPIIERSSGDPNKSLSISFRILEQEDGFTGQIVYKGNPDAGITISGTIKGARQITTTAKLIRGRYRRELLIWGSIFLVVLLVITFITVIFILDLVRSEEYHKSSIFALTRPDQSRSTRLRVHLILSVLLGAAWILLVYSVKNIATKAERRAERQAPTVIIQKVPKDIIP